MLRNSLLGRNGSDFGNTSHYLTLGVAAWITDDVVCSYGDELRAVDNV